MHNYVFYLKILEVMLLMLFRIGKIHICQSVLLAV